MSYTVKSSEKLRKSGAEAETKALLYLMNFRPDSNDIYYFVVDFFNDLTGMNNMANRLWDLQSKGAHNVGPKAIGKELVTLFKNYMSDFSFEAYILFVGSVSGALRIDPSLTVFGIANVKETAIKLIKDGLIEEGKAKGYIDNKDLTDENIGNFLNDVLFVIDDDKKPSEYVRAIIKQHPNIIPEDKVLDAIFNEIRDKQSGKKNVSVVEGVVIETTDEALNYCRHLTNNEIRLMTLQRIINRDPLSQGIPISFVSTYNAWQPEQQREMLEECQGALCRALFNKNAADGFWFLFENTYQMIVAYPNETVQQLFGRLQLVPNCVSRCPDFDAISISKVFHFSRKGWYSTMKILKVAVGNSKEAYIESGFSDGLNIISSDDNNKGKTIIIQSMMYALGNAPTFPTSFDYQKYYYYVEFEESNKAYQICRSGEGFILRQASSVLIFDNVSELKRYWNKHISPLPSIVKNQLSRIVDPVLYMQLFFVGQDKKDTSNIAHHGFYNKQDYVEMLYAYAGLGTEQLSQEKIDAIKSQISTLSDERKILLQQHKILKSKKAPVSYLSAESDRLAFGEKVASLEKVQAKISELRKQRNAATTRKSKWDYTINELRSLNRTISCGELRCMDCNSTNISFSTGEIMQTSYSFDVSTVEMRNEIIRSIAEKIAAYAEEIERLSAEINTAQEQLQALMNDESVSLESIVAYKKDIFSASDAESRIKEIEDQVASLKNQLAANENSSHETQSQRSALLTEILEKMNALYRLIDPDGNLVYTSLFTQRNEVYSGSEATVFHLVKLFALQAILRHSYPIVIDSFRAEDLSTGKESTVLELAKEVDNQVIFTTTLKREELGKYDSVTGITHINYQTHTPSKILDTNCVDDFIALMSDLSIEIQY